MKQFIGLILLTSLLACTTQPELEGLWEVKSVSVGEESMTPNARWMSFHADHTQTSGNGLFQHSYGTWSRKENQLMISNENGLDDPYEPFTIQIDAKEMTWKRTEDGQEVEVQLERIDKLPLTYGDHLLGLWQLEEMKGNGNFFSETKGENDYLFFRWDKRFVINTESGRISGVYQVNGHRPQVTLFPYSDDLKRSSWNLKLDQDQIIMSQSSNEKSVSRTFKRIHQFPN